MIKKITNNEYVFSVIAKISGVLLGLIYTVLFSRYFKPELRGTSTIIYTYSEFLMLILCFGTYQAYPYFKRKGKKNVLDEYINIVSGLFLLYAILVIVIIAVIRPDIKISAIIILIPLSFAIKEFQYAVMIENPTAINRANIFLSFFENILILCFMLFVKSSLETCAFFMVLREVLYLLVIFSRLKINIFKIRPTLKRVTPYITFGFLPMLTVIMMELNYKADVAMMHSYGISDSEIGVYGLGVSLASKVWLIPDALKDILTSKLAKGKKEDEVCKVLRISLAVIMIFVFILIILGKPFVNILYGNEFASAYAIIVIMLIGVIGMVFYKIIYSYNVINGYQKTNLFILTVAAIVNVIMNYILIPIWYSNGAAFASSVSYLLCGFMYIYIFSRRTKTPIKELVLIKKNDIEKIKKIL